MVSYSDEALEAFAIIVWTLAFVLFLVALALPCPLCRRDVRDWTTCCNKCVTSLLGLVFVSHLVTSDEGTLHSPSSSFSNPCSRSNGYSSCQAARRCGVILTKIEGLFAKRLLLARSKPFMRPNWRLRFPSDVDALLGPLIGQESYLRDKRWGLSVF
jgi:hypothetical protein